MKYQEDLVKGEKAFKKNQRFLKSLKRKKPKNLDEAFHSLHEEVFDEIDCLDCANCCKTTSPIFIMQDIERISDRLKTNPQDFINKYLKVDEDGDYVLHSTPCPFLPEDNICQIYEIRPRACREYPHTNRKRMHQILDLTLKNTMICPAAQRIVNRLPVKL